MRGPCTLQPNLGEHLALGSFLCFLGAQSPLPRHFFQSVQTHFLSGGLAHQYRAFE